MSKRWFRSQRAPELCLTLSLLALGGGCYAREDGERLAKESLDHDRRLRALERVLPETQEKIAALKDKLDAATSTVTRNSADLVTDVDQLREQLSTLEGQIAEAKHLTESLGKQVTEQASAVRQGGDPALNASQIPSDRNQHFRAGQQAYDAGDRGKARALFREYVRRYKTDRNADDAQYLIGRSFLLDNRPANALGALRKVVAEFPKSDSIPKALLDMGDAFYRLHACTDARSALQTLIRTHRRHPLARRARTKMREISRAPRGYCTS